MTAEYLDTLHGWQSFYFMTGGAAAGLVGLMFVAMSLALGAVSSEQQLGFRPFVTPTIIYFGTIVWLAGVLLFPTLAPVALGGVVIVSGIIGLVQALPHIRFLFSISGTDPNFSRTDFVSQLIMPFLGYGLVITSGVGFLLGAIDLSFGGLWLGVLVLLICGIANSYSLVLWILERRGT